MEDFGYQKDETQSNFSRLLKKNFLIAATLLSIACFVYITISAYYFVYHDENSNIETIKSPEGPIKVAEDVSSDHQSPKDQISSSIYDDLFTKKKESINRVAPKIRIAPEPALPPKQEEAKPDHRLIRDEIIAKNNVSKDKRIVVYSDSTPEKQATKDLLTKESSVKNSPAAIKTNESLAEQTKESAPTPKPTKRRYVRVQIAALASKSSAEDYWRKIQYANSSLFSGIKPYVEEVNLGKRGIFYRLQLGNFSDQVDAETFCNRYVSQTRKSRADCIVVE